MPCSRGLEYKQVVAAAKEASDFLDTASQSADPADLVISVSRRDLEALARGDLNPMTAAITGRLKVSDMGLAMSLMPQVKSLLAARSGDD